MPSEVMRIDITPPEQGSPIATASAAQLRGGTDMAKGVEEGLKNAGFTPNFFTKLLGVVAAGKVLQSDRARALGKIAGRNGRGERLRASVASRMGFNTKEEVAAAEELGIMDPNIRRTAKKRGGFAGTARGRKAAIIARRVGRTKAGRGVQSVAGSLGMTLTSAGAGIATAILAGAAAFAAVGEILSRTLADVSGSISAARARTDVQTFKTKLQAAETLGPIAELWESIKGTLLKLLSATLKILGPAIKILLIPLQIAAWILDKIADLIQVIIDILDPTSWAKQLYNWITESEPDNSGGSGGGVQRFGGAAGAPSISTNPAVQVVNPVGSIASAFESMEDSNESIAQQTIARMKMGVTEFVRKLDIARAEKLTLYESKIVMV